MNNSELNGIKRDLNFNMTNNQNMNIHQNYSFISNSYNNLKNIYLKNNSIHLVNQSENKNNTLISNSINKNLCKLNQNHNSTVTTKRKLIKLFENKCHLSKPSTFTNNPINLLQNIRLCYKWKIFFRKNSITQNLELLIKPWKETQNNSEENIMNLIKSKKESIKILDSGNPHQETIVNLIDILSNLSAKVCHEFRNPIINILGMVKQLKNKILLRQKKLEISKKVSDSNINLSNNYQINNNNEKNSNSINKTITTSLNCESDNIILNNLRNIKYLCHSINLTVSEIDLLSNILKIGDIELSKMKMIDKIKSNAVEINFRKEMKFIYKIFDNKISLSNKKIAFIVEIDDKIPTRINIDSDTLKKVLFILIENSIKFSNTGQIKLKILLNDDFLSFIISDEGIGIKQTSLNNNKIGSLFFKEENANNTYGLGLGLFIFKIYISALNGEYTIESNINLSGLIHSNITTGTTVKFDLPIFIKDKKDYKLLINDQRLDSEDEIYYTKKEMQNDCDIFMRYKTLPIKENLKRSFMRLESFEKQFDLEKLGKKNN